MDINRRLSAYTTGVGRLFSSTSLATTGKTVATLLGHLEQTKNRALYLQNTATMQKKMAAIGTKATGAEGWEVNVVFIDDVVQQAWAKTKNNKSKPGTFVFNHIEMSIWGEKYGSHSKEANDDLLGIKD